MQQLAFPAAFVEVEHTAGLLGEPRVAREDPRPVVPWADRVLRQPAPAALRERRGGGAPVSQKTLPEQEVLALALWLLGDPHNEQDLERIAAAHDEYRSRQLAAAADALRRST